MGLAPRRQLPQPDSLLQDPAQAIGGATAAAVAHLPPSAVSAADTQHATVDTMANVSQPQAAAAPVAGHDAVALESPSPEPGTRRRRLGLARRSGLSPQASAGSGDIPAVQPAASSEDIPSSSSLIPVTPAAAAAAAQSEAGQVDDSSPDLSSGNLKPRSSFRRFLRPKAAPQSPAADHTAASSNHTAQSAAASPAAETGTTAASSPRSLPEGESRKKPSLRSRLLHRRAANPAADTAPATAMTHEQQLLGSAVESAAGGSPPTAAAAGSVAEDDSSAGPLAEHAARSMEFRRISDGSSSDVSSERLAAAAAAREDRSVGNGSVGRLHLASGAEPVSGARPADGEVAAPARQPDDGEAANEAAASVRSCSEDSGALLAAAAAALPEATDADRAAAPPISKPTGDAGPPAQAADQRSSLAPADDSTAAAPPPERDLSPGSLRTRFAAQAAEAKAAADEATAAQTSAAATQIANAPAAHQQQPASPVLEIWEAVKQSASQEQLSSLSSPGACCLLGSGTNAGGHVDFLHTAPRHSLLLLCSSTTPLLLQRIQAKFHRRLSQHQRMDNDPRRHHPSLSPQPWAPQQVQQPKRQRRQHRPQPLAPRPWQPAQQLSPPAAMQRPHQSPTMRLQPSGAHGRAPGTLAPRLPSCPQMLTLQPPGKQSRQRHRPLSCQWSSSIRQRRSHSRAPSQTSLRTG